MPIYQGKVIMAYPVSKWFS